MQKTIALVSVMLLSMTGGNVIAAQEKQTEAVLNEPPKTTAPNSGVQAPTKPEATPTVNHASAANESLAQAALKKAAAEKKHLFLFVAENDSDETAATKRTVEASVMKIKDKAAFAFIKRDSTAEKEIIEKYQLIGAPMPIVLAFAPNGAITGAYFGEKLDKPELQNSIASESEQQCMKALQDGKLVFLCAQNTKTKSNDLAMQGVNDFKADAQFASFTEIVKLDPSSPAEQPFLTKLKIDPPITEAITAFISPPGTIVAKVNGATTKDALVSALKAALSGGCGPKGCGPKGCGPKQ